LTETQHYYASQVDAIQLAAALSETEAIDCDRQSNGFYEVAQAARVVPELAESQNLLAKHFAIDSRVLPAKKFAAAGHRARRRQARDRPRTGKGSSSV